MVDDVHAVTVDGALAASLPQESQNILTHLDGGLEAEVGVVRAHALAFLLVVKSGDNDASKRGQSGRHAQRAPRTLR